MKVKPKNQPKYVLLITFIVIVIGYGFSALSEFQRCKEINGKLLPRGVQVSECKTMVNDNFFHSAMFMKIDNASDFNGLIHAIGASDEFQSSDALSVIGSINKALNESLSKEEIEIGYEIPTNGRDNWFLVGKNGYSFYIEN